MKKNAAIVGDVTSIEEVVAQIIARDPDLLAAVKQKIANTLEEIDITEQVTDFLEDTLQRVDVQSLLQDLIEEWVTTRLKDAPARKVISISSEED